MKRAIDQRETEGRGSLYRMLWRWHFYATGPPDGGSMSDKAWAFDPSSARYNVSLYAPNYFLFGRYTTDLNTAPFDPLIGNVIKPGTELDRTEAAFQLSFKFRLWTTDDRRLGVWAAYTQQSQWQLYNDSGNASRPFRETNYMPELILGYKPGLRLGDAQVNLFTLAINHQSNGRTDQSSRSWNRIIAGAGVEHGNFALMGRLWLRILREAAEAENQSLRTKLGKVGLSESIVGAQTGLREIMQRVEQVARADVPVLILGESGSGKEVIARAIQERSGRSKGPFLRVNCGAIASELVDSELFGHEKGSFTGALGLRRVGSSGPTAERCCSMNAANSLRAPRCVCCACCKTARSSASAAKRKSP